MMFAWNHRGSGVFLRDGGLLVLYGPFKVRQGEREGVAYYDYYYYFYYYCYYY